MRLKLTPELIGKIARDVGEGNYINTVCQAYGISKTTYYDWRKKGQAGRSKLHKEFYEATEKAVALSEQRYVGVIKDAARDGTWTAAAWWLERRYPERWGKRDKVDVTSGGKPLQTLDLKSLSDEEINILEKVIGGSAGNSPNTGGNTGGESQA